ncbi:hypothetical protein MCOR25_004627 [Pyricularia grisea]|uniref:J domain-containing protein n=1 Tax=Pyricularia grisea TaxID=148305 RepID=A0A6P8ARF9_PYRGI|nr:uncharacterized protein PgNI_09357 [Pyricularia grisea]KAI6368509.1 hypothetical protein MCOR25_004627 [Pyricularia grisea]TLD04690.1 hypothetical protein PgNI_09357 [Pyricularia grisea]
MKFSALSLGLLAFLSPLTAAWSAEDREIFRVRDELIAGEGKDVNFYDYVGVAQSASVDEIGKAYRKKSRLLHPDKVKQQLTAERTRQAKEDKSKKPKPPTQAEVRAAVKKASDRQARLSIVANILKSPSRDRYDHFLSNGFPTWKGTNYYYNRYRPGLGTAMFGVFLFGGGLAHYLALYMSWKRQRDFVGRYIKFARQTAWGDNLNIPGVETRARTPPPPVAADDDEGAGPAMAMNRKQRRMQERETRREASKGAVSRTARRARSSAAPSGSATPTPQGSGPTGAKKRVVAENGKVLVVDSLGDVYLEEENEEGQVVEYLLDPNEIPQPTIRDTALVRLPVWAYSRTIGRVLGSKDSVDEVAYDEDAETTPLMDDNEDSASEPGKRTPSTDSAEDFELVEKSVDSLGQAKSSGKSSGNKPGKRKNKKR